MELVNSYFSELLFTLVDRKGGYGIYAAGIDTRTGDGQRYVFLYVLDSSLLPSRTTIEDLNWASVSTRQLKGSYPMKQQMWNPNTDSDIALRAVSRNDSYTTYMTQGFPYEVRLLNNPRRKTKYQYSNNMMLSSAIDTFSCILQPIKTKNKDSQSGFYSP